jgi:predicted nucleotidyltransferase
MDNQFNEFLKILDALDKARVDYILIGGVAVVLNGFDRLTNDMDIFIEVIPQNIENLKNTLYSLYKDPSINEIQQNDFDSYPVIRYGTPNGFNIDIIGKLGEMAKYGDLDYEVMNIQGVNIKIATPETLFKLKKDTLREKDKIDAFFLSELIKKRKTNR